MLPLPQVQQWHHGRLLVLRRVPLQDLVNQPLVLSCERERYRRIVVGCVAVLRTAISVCAGAMRSEGTVLTTARESERRALEEESRRIAETEGVHSIRRRAVESMIRVGLCSDMAGAASGGELRRRKRGDEFPPVVISPLHGRVTVRIAAPRYLMLTPVKDKRISILSLCCQPRRKLNGRYLERNEHEKAVDVINL